MRKKLLTVFGAIAFINATAQSYTIKSTDTYDAGALYGYMNGGSELYHEFGFKELTVKEVEANDETLTLEYFQMQDSINAYGIYSVNVHKCGTEKNDAKLRICQNAYQLQAVIGEYYLSFINTTGSKAAMALSEKLLNEFIEDHNEAKSYQFPDMINTLDASNVFYMRGILGIENRASKWSTYYNLLKPKEFWILKWKDSKNSMMIIENQSPFKFSLLDINEDTTYSIKGKQVGKHVYLLRFPKGEDESAMKVLDKI